MNSGSDIISVEQAARLLHGQRHLVFALVLRREIKAIGTGPEIKVSKREVEAYARTHPHPTDSVRSERESLVWH